jgi:transcriptional regulator with XRE-family HTH domain
MKKRTQHPSVSDMVRSLSEDPSFADEFLKRLSGRQLIKVLTVLRTRAGLSQQELAEKLHCTQSKVSKLESSNDTDLRFGDLLDYTSAVEHEMRLFLVPKGRTLLDEVQMHAYMIQRLLHCLIRLAGSDGAMTKGVANFLEEAAWNLTKMAQTAAAALPPTAEESRHPLRVEAPDVESEGLASLETETVDDDAFEPIPQR